MVFSLDPRSGEGDDREYDLTSFSWHRYEGRPSDTDPDKNRQTQWKSPIRRQVPVERLLDPTITSALPSRSASPVHQFTDAAAVCNDDDITRRLPVDDAFTNSLADMPNIQDGSIPALDASFAHDPGLVLPTVDYPHQSDIGSSENHQDSLAQGLLSFFDFDNSLSMPVSVVETAGFGGVQRDMLSNGFWMGDSAFDETWLDTSVQSSLPPDQLPFGGQSTYSDGQW